MKRLLVMSVTAMLALGGLAAVVEADSGEGPKQSAESQHFESLLLGRIRQPQDVGRIAPPRCNQTDPVAYKRCINRYLTKLAKTLDSQLKSLNSLWNCLQYIDVTQYFGYVFDNEDGTGQFLTTGLDLTEEGSTADFFVAVIKDKCRA